MIGIKRVAGAPLVSQKRYPYSPIVERPAYRWPGGARLAIHVSLGLEIYDSAAGLTEDLVPTSTRPDVLNDCWRDYGNRVGAWRILDAFRSRGWPLGILLNSALCEHAPELVKACSATGCELIGHGYSNSDSLAGLSESEETAYLQRVAAQIRTATGTAPQGWASPWIAETSLTPDLLQESGYRYLLDWCMDDQPVWLSTRNGRIVSVPYSQELNDSSAIIGRHTGSQEFADMIVDQFDEMRATDDGRPLVMSIVLHSFICGQPFRLRALRRALDHIAQYRDELWLTQPGAIARHFEQISAKAP